MKKSLSVILIFIFILSFSFSAFAEGKTYQVSEDLQSVVCSDGFTYKAVDLSKSNYPDEYSELEEKDFLIPSTTLGKPLRISGEIYEEAHFLALCISFENGSSFTCNYMREDKINAYNTLSELSADLLTIEFDFPEENSLNASTTLLKGEKCILSGEELEWCEYFYCHAIDPKVPLKVRAGALLVIEDQFYFVDFSEITQEDPSWFSPFEYNQLSAYKIKDTALLSELKSGFARNTYGDFASLGNKDLLELLHWILLATLLFFLPLVGLILCIIFALRSANYRKAFLFGAIGLTAELIGFLIYVILKIL